MAKKAFRRRFKHPHSFSDNHKHLVPTEFDIHPFTALAVPFWWMLNSNQKAIDDEFGALPYNDKAPFPSAWVFGEKRQNALLELFFKSIHKEQSLVAFYTKNGNPIDENCNRLIVGIGEVKDKSGILRYNKNGPGADYPIWDRKISHSIREDGTEGFLIPYHEYLALEEKTYIIDGQKFTKQELIDAIKVPLLETGESDNRTEDFSYGSEHVENRNMLSLLLKLRRTVETIIKHGLVAGPWSQRLVWINNQIGKVKENMGPFPAFAQALIALGFEHGYLFAHDLYESKICEPKGNPWDLLEDVLGGFIPVMQERNRVYVKEYPLFRDRWNSMGDIQKELIILLSRFDLNHKQIKRWLDPDERRKNQYEASSAAILENPYIIVEEDRPEFWEPMIAVETIDSGVFEDRSIQGDYVPEGKWRIESKLDPRRIRAMVVSVLNHVALEGDTLLSAFEIRQRLQNLSMNQDIEIPFGILDTYSEFIQEKLVYIRTDEVEAYQLKFYEKVEQYLSQKFIKRAAKELPSLNESWDKLIIESIAASGYTFDPKNERHKAALEDQTEALERVTSRKLSILNGPAGTGKTSVMGALVRSKKLKAGGILLLAPTGKARVRLGKMANQEGLTIAQFLTKQKRFDWKRMEPIYFGKETYKGEKTIVIDECSMLTVKDFYAIFQALDLLHVERIILVGDPFQLPPIGPGRPFADLCGYLAHNRESEEVELKSASYALAELKVVVRTLTDGSESDILQLSSWFSGRKQGKNADLIFDKIGQNEKLNDLMVHCWKTPEDILPLISKILEDEFDVNPQEPITGFSQLLGIEEGDFPETNPDDVEKFQILTPVKVPAWGTGNVNRFIQHNFRTRPTEYWQKTLGDQQILEGDKVIQIKNQKRDGYKNGTTTPDVQLSNGQIGVVVSVIKGNYNTAFAGHEGYTFGYTSKEFSEDGGTIELAYAITVHKSQGSDFDTVFFILPKSGRILSRELIYTGLTRAKGKLVLLVEGEDPHWIFNYSKAEASETYRRNTHLFSSQIRDSMTSIPFAQNLIHRTKEGIFVRSKSEVIVGNLLHDAEILFEYERTYDSPNGKRLPDFSLISNDDELIILEHLGMMNKPSYREEWERKLEFYKSCGFDLGINLFTTTEDDNGAIDSEKINKELIPILKKLTI